MTDLVFDLAPLDAKFAYYCTLNRATFASDVTKAKDKAFTPDLLVPGFLRIWPAVAALCFIFVLRPCTSVFSSWHDYVTMATFAPAAYLFYQIHELLDESVCWQQWWKGAPLLTPTLKWHLYIGAALAFAMLIQLYAAFFGRRKKGTPLVPTPSRTQPKVPRKDKKAKKFGSR